MLQAGPPLVNGLVSAQGSVRESIEASWRDVITQVTADPLEWPLQESRCRKNTMDEKNFLNRCQQTLLQIESAVEQAADEGADVDFEMQGGILEIECADGSKIIVSPHVIAQEIWVAARSGGFHFRHDDALGWVDTRTGAPLFARLVEILQQQGQVSLQLR